MHARARYIQPRSRLSPKSGPGATCGTRPNTCQHGGRAYGACKDTAHAVPAHRACKASERVTLAKENLDQSPKYDHQAGLILTHDRSPPTGGHRQCIRLRTLPPPATAPESLIFSRTTTDGIAYIGHHTWGPGSPTWATPHAVPL